MIKIRVERISGNTPFDNHHGRNAAFGKKGRFGIPLLILLTILLLPFTVAADSLTCSRLPLLMEHFQANHYAIKSMTEEIKMHVVLPARRQIDAEDGRGGRRESTRLACARKYR